MGLNLCFQQPISTSYTIFAIYTFPRNHFVLMFPYSKLDSVYLCCYLRLEKYINFSHLLLACVEVYEVRYSCISLAGICYSLSIAHLPEFWDPRV